MSLVLNRILLERGEGRIILMVFEAMNSEMEMTTRWMEDVSSLIF